MLSMTDLFVVGVTSVATSALAWRFVFHKAPLPQPEHTTPHHTSFLFDRGLLVDCSQTAEELLQSLEFEVRDWQDLARLLRGRFPDFPADPPASKVELPFHFDSMDFGKLSRVRIEATGRRLKVQILETPDPHETAVTLFHNRQRSGCTETLEMIVDGTPNPSWRTNAEGQIVWANQAYLNLASEVSPTEPITEAAPQTRKWPDFFPKAEAGPHNVTKPQDRRRVAVPLSDGSQTLWYDITSVHNATGQLHYANDINAVVQAEIAQRNFVQTLTKTFAQLSIGLAIFDRKRELTLFNPALTDLTELPANFLSNRPSLNSFFDRLRDSQMMPEPRNYKDWRSDLAALTSEAANGQYLETWTLPSGLIYRVSGRPHPNGALAFLFEDISAEVSLTRRFRTELEINHDVLNRIDSPMAIFTDGGLLHYCNRAYGQLWGVDHEASFAEISLMDSLQRWRKRARCDRDLKGMISDLTQIGPEALTGTTFTLPNGAQLTAHFQRIPHSATLVNFARTGEAQARLILAHSA